MHGYKEHCEKVLRCIAWMHVFSHVYTVSLKEAHTNLLTIQNACTHMRIHTPSHLSLAKQTVHAKLYKPCYQLSLIIDNKVVIHGPHCSMYAFTLSLFISPWKVVIWVFPQEREKQVAKCCWDDEMEAKYQQYEADCRLKFGVELPEAVCANS